MKKAPNPYDLAVGNRIKHYRIQAKLSQEKVADKLDLTFQQVQKYEKGTNRIAPSRLIVLSKLFNVPMAAFFGEDNKGTSREPELIVHTATRRELIDELERIGSAKLETALLNVVRTWK
jgi:transcriptional regulator with XRE-family HTH domain